MAEVEVDSLSLSISENSGGAVRSLDALIDKLKELKENCNMSDVTAGVQHGMEGIQEVAEEAEKAAKGTEELGKGAQVASAGLAVMGASAVLAVNGLIKIRDTISRVTRMIGKMIIMRLFRASMRVINQGFHEGLENLYRYSEAMGSLDSANTKNSLDSVASSLLYVKNSIGAAVAPIIQSLVPVLQTVVNRAVQAANAINQFISSIQGKSTYTRAKLNATTYFSSVSKGAGAANKAAKELQATLFGFDEINRLDSASKGGGAGGIAGGAGVPSYGDMFEEAAIDMKFLDNIKKKFQEILKIVTLIGVAIASWKIGSALSKIMGLDLGQALKFTAGLTLAITGLTLEVMGITDIVTEGINLKNLGETLLGGATLIGGGALIGSAFGSALIGGAIAALVAGVGFVTGAFIDALTNGFSGLDAVLFDLGYVAIFSGVGALVGGPLGAALGAISGVIYGGIGALELWLLSSIVSNWEDIKKVLTDARKWISANFVSPVSTGFSNVYNTLKTRAKEAITAVMNYFAPVTAFFRTVFSGVKTAVTTVWTDIKTAAGNVWQWISKTVKTVWADISTAAKWTFTTIISGVQPIATWFGNIFASVKKTVTDVFYNIRVIVTGVWATVRTVISAWYAWLRESIITPLMARWNTLWGKLTEGASKAYSVIKTVFGGLASYFGTIFSNAWERVKKVFSVGGTIFKGIAEAVSKAFKTVVNSLIVGINKVVAIPFAGINTALDKLRGFQILGARPFSSLRSITVPKIPYMAEGGFVPGDLFVANDAGPELVGTVNRRTAVASNTEITGIADAVYGTGAEESRLLREQNNLLRQLLEKNMTAVVTADSIVAGLARKNRRDGVSAVPVGV